MGNKSVARNEVKTDRSTRDEKERRSRTAALVTERRQRLMRKACLVDQDKEGGGSRAVGQLRVLTGSLCPWR